MKIYSTRHGQTDYNKQGIIMGSTDLPLNDTGCQQAEKLKKAWGYRHNYSVPDAQSADDGECRIAAMRT